VLARGWCPRHYQRWRVHGSTDVCLTTQGLGVTARFWAKVDKSGECWLSTGARRGDGYGAFQVESKRQIGAHRFSYILHHGDIAEGTIVMHSCDVPICVNPAHLSLGTPSENTRDAVRKGRWGSRKTL
jgi:hypothetical protein